LKEFWGNFN
jgi:dynein heavy chain, axonemal